MYVLHIFCLSLKYLKTLCQAYDGHMNLILSDVEETIMVVDVEGAPEGQGTVKVGLQSTLHSPPVIDCVCSGCKTKNGDAVCERGWCDFGAFKEYSIYVFHPFN